MCCTNVIIGLLLTTFVCGQKRKIGAFGDASTRTSFYSIRRRRYYAPCGKEDRTKMNGVFTYAHIPDMRLNDEEEKTAKN
mmetsp:Transcript_10950/g.16245  ORF Transcript_10950/g.16245 Transcript_10950/m.16245 type:complete len:80 (-) Transcript_10950:246-485(-)